ncbi:MAG TPA: MFS transporter, partial [Chitinophagaceae bacterium]
MNTTRMPWRIVSILSATATAGYMCRVNVSTAGPLLMKEFSLSEVEMGRVFSAFILGYALFQVPAGALADKWGTRKVLMLAAWLWVIVTVLQATVGLGFFQASIISALTAFMIYRFMLGIAASPTYPASGKGVASWVEPPLQGRANGVVLASIGLGAALTPPLVSNVMVNWGWRIALVISAVPALIVALLWRRIHVPKTSPTKAIQKDFAFDTSSDSAKLRSKNFILLSISYTLEGYIAYIFVTWFYIYLVRERHFELLSGAWMSSLAWILTIISIPLGGIIADRLGSKSSIRKWSHRVVPMIGLSSSAALISIGAHTQSAIVAAISLSFATALILCVEAPFWTTMMKIVGKNSGTGGGIMNMGTNAAGAISPVLTPLIASYVGWESALHIAAIIAVVAAVLWLGIKVDG